MKPDAKIGASNAPVAGPERRFEVASAGPSFPVDRMMRCKPRVAKRNLIPFVTLVVAILVFLFGTDVVGRYGGIVIPRELDGAPLTTESMNQREPRLTATYQTLRS